MVKKRTKPLQPSGSATKPVIKNTNKEIECPEETEFFIGSLAKNVTESDIISHFESFGEVSSIRILGDSQGRNRCAAIIKVITSNTDPVLGLNKSILLGKTIKVQLCSERRRKNADNKESAVVFVGNLPCNITEDSVGVLFETYGCVKEVRIAREEENGRFRGFCYVEFFENSSALNSLKANEFSLEGKALRVDLAEAQRGRPQSLNRPYIWNPQIS